MEINVVPNWNYFFLLHNSKEDVLRGKKIADTMKVKEGPMLFGLQLSSKYLAEEIRSYSFGRT